MQNLQMFIIENREQQQIIINWEADTFITAWKTRQKRLIGLQNKSKVD